MPGSTSNTPVPPPARWSTVSSRSPVQGHRCWSWGRGPAAFMVDRTDGAESFVARLRMSGHAARVLDIRADDFGGPYDAVFASAVLLHLPRRELTGVLRVALRSTRVGGVLVASFKEGAGEGWSSKMLSDISPVGRSEICTTPPWLPGGSPRRSTKNHPLPRCRPVDNAGGSAPRSCPLGHRLPPFGASGRDLRRAPVSAKTLRKIR